MPDKPLTLTSLGFTPLPSGNTVFVPVTSTTPVARITDQETLAEKDYRNRLDLRILKELWGLPLDIKRWRPGRMPYDDVWLAGLHKVHRDPQPFSLSPLSLVASCDSCVPDSPYYLTIVTRRCVEMCVEAMLP